jgi:HTH-type transcriptional regulator/antitoxin MqsA
VPKVVTERFEYKGQTLTYPNYLIHECSACGEAIVDKKCLKESGRAIRDFYRKVDGLLTASEIRQIRLRLGLSQDAASDLLGGGAKSFARYENCEVIQSVAMDNLLRLLDANPRGLGVLENKNKPQTYKVISTTMVYHTKCDKSKLVVNNG